MYTETKRRRIEDEDVRGINFDKILEMAGMGGSVVGFVSVISGFLPAYYRFWDESVRPPRRSPPLSTCFAKILMSK
jgi:hypothetical protein